MKQAVKIFTITSVLAISFLTLADKNNLSDADKDNSSDEKQQPKWHATLSLDMVNH